MNKIIRVALLGCSICFINSCNKTNGLVRLNDSYYQFYGHPSEISINYKTVHFDFTSDVAKTYEWRSGSSYGEGATVTCNYYKVSANSLLICQSSWYEYYYGMNKEQYIAKYGVSGSYIFDQPSKSDAVYSISNLVLYDGYISAGSDLYYGTKSFFNNCGIKITEN